MEAIKTEDEDFEIWTADLGKISLICDISFLFSPFSSFKLFLPFYLEYFLPSWGGNTCRNNSAKKVISSLLCTTFSCSD